MSYSFWLRLGACEHGLEGGSHAAEHRAVGSTEGAPTDRACAGPLAAVSGTWSPPVLLMSFALKEVVVGGQAGLSMHSQIPLQLNQPLFLSRIVGICC